MKSRPPGLPDYAKPPVTEVVLGVQFGGIDRLMAPHLGPIHQAFADKFPDVEQHAPIDPAFEMFPEKGAGPLVGRFQLQLMDSADTPRIFFIAPNKTELLQVQRDRFIHNWRKLNEADVYPHFEQLIETFATYYKRLEVIVARERLGEIAPNQCEVSYINQIIVPQDETIVGAFERIFGNLKVTTDLDELGKPEDVRFSIRYVMRDAASKPTGRLNVSAEPALRGDGTQIVQLTFLARGRPAMPNLDAVSEFLLLGRRRIVQSFDRLTSPKMHKIWEKRQ